MRITSMAAAILISTLALCGCETTSSNVAASAPTTRQDATAKPAPAPQVAQAPQPPANPLIDSILPGDEAAEKAHNVQGKDDETGDFNDRTYRHSPGGWFSWDMKVLPDLPNALVLTYWGSDQRSFDIFIDGQKLVGERIANSKPEEFFDKSYLLPEAMTKGKTKVTVKFAAQTANGYAGGVFGAKIMWAGAVKGAITP